MLVDLLSSQYVRFAALAEAWLAQGAEAFGIFQDDRPLIYWPAGHRLVDPSIASPIVHNGAEIGDLRVVGISGTAAEARLKADAALVSHIIQLEGELQYMTADLVTSQDQQLALYRLTQTMRDHVTISETLQALVAEALRMVRVEAAFALFIPANGQDPQLVQKPVGFCSTEMIWPLYWQTQSREHELNYPETDTELQLPSQIRNLLLMPIWVRGSIMAGLGLVNRPGSFGTPDLKLARAIADQASAQIERMLLYKEMFDQTKMRTEMELARRVQLELLPSYLPQVEGLEIYANSRPALQVGGDFFDFVVDDNRPFVFSLGDVTGKGLSAALLMTMTRLAIHSKAQFMPYPTPEAIMRQSNEDLYNDFTQVGVFATAFVGQYEVGKQELIYANAGHAPVIYRPCDGEPVLLRADSTAIGILPISYCRNQVIAMRPGDVLVVATDGFSDARNHDDETFDIDRLMELIDRVADQPAHEIANALFAAVDQFGGDRQQDDDQTLVVIKGAGI